MVYDNAFTGNQILGLRFSSVDIPKYAIITNAYLDFATREGYNDTATFKSEIPSKPSPKPFTDRLLICSNVAIRERKIRYAFDSESGRLILSGESETDFSGTAEIDATLLPPGMDILRYGSGDMHCDPRRWFANEGIGV